MQATAAPFVPAARQVLQSQDPATQAGPSKPRSSKPNDSNSSLSELSADPVVYEEQYDPTLVDELEGLLSHETALTRLRRLAVSFASLCQGCTRTS